MHSVLRERGGEVSSLAPGPEAGRVARSASPRGVRSNRVYRVPRSYDSASPSHYSRPIP
ncbi:hypothetical protein T484DRAFT_1949661 [Baffinella frigidus]|nr:hypothetical protein T484DRAFT_1949661 [Cryptophyta sp. CCMP2293]